MNVKTLSIVAGLVAAFGSTTALAAADEYTLNQNMPAAAATAPAAASTFSSRPAVRVAVVDEYQRSQFPAAGPSTLQRAQVVAEAKEARRLGLIAEGESYAVPTPAQAEQIRLAGLPAVEASRFAAKH